MSSITDPKCILLRGNPPQREALVSATALTPGMAAALDSAGKLALPTHGQNIKPKIIKEHDWTGKGIDDAFSQNDSAPYYSPRSGDQFWAWHKDTDSIAAGALMMLHSDGSFQSVTSGGTPVAVALQTQDTTGGASGLTRLKVEML